MTELQSSLLKAMKEVNNYGVKHTDMNITILGTITQVIDANLGIYKARYYDAEITIYSSAGIYQKGDVVYIIVPNGDFSQDKFILGLKRS